MTINEIISDIHALEEELIDFERKYGIRSETFFAAYMDGEEPEFDAWSLDFGEWTSVYKTWLSRQSDYRTAVQKIQRNSLSLKGLLRRIRLSPFSPEFFDPVFPVSRFS